MLSKRKEYLFNMARAASQLSNGKHKLGCVIETRSNVVAGFNKNRNHPSIAHNGECAERRALRLSPEFDRATAYVVRLNKHGEDRLAKPCAACEAALRDAGVKKVFYTIAPNKYGVLKL